MSVNIICHLRYVINMVTLRNNIRSVIFSYNLKYLCNQFYIVATSTSTDSTRCRYVSGLPIIIIAIGGIIGIQIMLCGDDSFHYHPFLPEV